MLCLKKDLTAELHVCVSETLQRGIAGVEPAVESSAVETPINETHARVHYVAAQTFQWVP